MNDTRRSNDPVPFSELQRRKLALEQRLDDGFVRIGEAEVLGKDVRAWESFWLSLLGEYESVCDELDQAA